MTSLTINAEMPTPAGVQNQVQKRKIFALGLIHYKSAPKYMDNTGAAEEMRVMGLMMVEDQTAGSSNSTDAYEQER